MAAVAGMRDVELLDPPSDGISSVRFSPVSHDLLLAASWDGFLRLYDVANNVLKKTFANNRTAALDCCFSAHSPHAYSSSIDGTVRSFDLESRADKILGSHEKGAKCLEYCASEGLLISGGWDSTMRFWDTRSPQALIGSYLQPAKVFAMAVSGSRVIVGTAARHVYIYDVRKMAEPLQRRESSLKHQTRCIRAFPDQTGYALSSVEGRCAIEYFDPSEEVQKQKYVFKCHRALINGVDTVYPVNSIAFHPDYGTFATGGCDGLVNIWDGANRKRIHQLSRFPTSIASLAFSEHGKFLAVASSYTFEEGEKDHPPDAIFIHAVQDAEVKPKPRAAAA